MKSFIAQISPHRTKAPRVCSAPLSVPFTSFRFLFFAILSSSLSIALAPLSADTPESSSLPPQLSSTAKALGYRPNQIIVKYKDLSQSPLANLAQSAQSFSTQTEDASRDSQNSISPNISHQTAYERGYKQIQQISVQTNDPDRQKTYLASFEHFLPPTLSALRAEQEGRISVSERTSTAQNHIPAYALIKLIGEDEVVPLAPIIETFRRDPNVEFAVRNDLKKLHQVRFERTDLPNDRHFDLQWGLENGFTSGNDIEYLKAWALSKAPDPSQPVIIAIIDSNFDSQHPDLKDRLWVNSQEIPNNNIDDDGNGYIDDIHGFNFSSNNASLDGATTHGTHVAGISIAEGNNAVGISGVMPNIQFIGLACDAGGNFLDGFAIFSAKEYVLALKNRGENIVAVNASYGNNSYNAFEKDLIESLSNAGVLFCAAAGNDNWNLDIESDIDKDGRMDTGEDLNFNRTLDPGEDRDGDGVLDLTEDLDGDGRFDLIDEDRNFNNIFDLPYEDRDRDGHFDRGIEDIDGDRNFDNVNEDINGDEVHNINYPSSYDLPNIISVASSTTLGARSWFSNYGRVEVDIAAPGSSILSTFPFHNTNINTLSLSNGDNFTSQFIDNSPTIGSKGISGSLIDCGIGNPNDIPQSVNGQIALIQRGSLQFTDKVTNAIAAGAIAVVIDNNIAEDYNELRRFTMDANIANAIPAVSISQADGNQIRAHLENATLTATLSEKRIETHHAYEYESGTSMASPMVCGAVAFAALNFPDESMVDRRNRILNNAQEISDFFGVVVTNGLINLKNIVDTDGDDLPDWWEMEQFSSLATSDSTDSDNDGYSNRQEYVAQTNPNQSADSPEFKSHIEISDFEWSDSDQLSFSFMAYPQLEYTVESSSNLEQAWSTAQSYSGDGTPLRVEIDAPTDSQSRSFYRLSVSE